MRQTKLLIFWNPFGDNSEISGAELFAEYFAQDACVILIDLKNNTDPQSMHLLREADLAVIFLRQERRILDRYFCSRPLRNKKTFYIIYDYFGEIAREEEYLIRRYRISRQSFGVLPYNSRLTDAAERGCLRGYLKCRQCINPGEQLSGFFDCLSQTEKKLQLSLFDSGSRR